VSPGREPGDVTDVAEQPRRSGRADPVQPHQVAAGLGEQGGQLLLRRLDPSVDDVEFIDQLGGQVPAGLTDHVTGGHVSEQGPGLPCGQGLLRPAGHELDQQPVQPIDGHRPGGAELVAAVGQQPQRDGRHRG